MKCKSGVSLWPCKMRQVPVGAPYFDGADLLIAADCAAYACREFHDRFGDGHIVLVGCVQSEGEACVEKLSRIFSENNVRSVTVVRMEVPCCGGLPRLVEEAISASGREIPRQVITLSTDGKILE